MTGLRLRVKEARLEDIGRGIVRLCADDLPSLPGSGDVVLILGRQSAAARMMLGGEPGAIRMDGALRADTDAPLGSLVTVERVTASPATAVVCTVFGPAARQGTQVLSGAEAVPLLMGRPVAPGSRLAFRHWGKGSSLLVTGVAPEGVVVITPVTRMTLVPADEEGPPRAQTSYEDIGGLKRELQRVREMVELPLRHPELFLALGIDPPKGLLLYGPPGTGKTLIARALASEVRAHFIHINGPEIMHKYYGESEARLREIFEEAERQAPSIIYLDELDAIAPKRAVVAGDVEKRIVGQLLALMDGLVARGRVIVIGATNMPDLLDPALRRPGRFDREIVTRVPDVDERLEILRIHTREMPLAPDVDLAHFAGATGGYVGADLEILCKEAAMAALRRSAPQLELDGRSIPSGLMVTSDDFHAALREVEPAATRELRAERPGVTFANVGGLRTVRAVLTRTLVAPMRRALAGRSDARLPQTYLFTGPPGVGKNLVARAAAGELGMSVITLEPAVVLSRWPGETERAVAEIFRIADHVAPCLVLLEDVDAVAPVRSLEGGAQMNLRLVSKLLHEMREARRTRGLVIIATTDRPELVDPAVAKGFEVTVAFTLPTPEEREEIFAMQLGALARGIDLSILAAASGGLSGGEIEAVCRQAAALALDRPLQMRDFEEALRMSAAQRAA